MAILALDLGTKTGWAIGTNGHIMCGTQDFGGSRYDSWSMRFVRFHRWLDEMCGASEVDEIAYEEVRSHKGVDAAHCYGAFLSHLLGFAEENEIPTEAMPVGEIKKYWTGKGNASKRDMIARAEMMGFPGVDDNAADALAILHKTLGMKVVA